MLYDIFMTVHYHRNLTEAEHTFEGQTLVEDKEHPTFHIINFNAVSHIQAEEIVNNFMMFFRGAASKYIEVSEVEHTHAEEKGN
jgi:ribosomal 30S subunit maturation factor RimM